MSVTAVQQLEIREFGFADFNGVYGLAERNRFCNEERSHRARIMVTTICSDFQR